MRTDGASGAGVLEPPDDPKALLAANREWVYACVTKNSEAVSAVPLRLYVRKNGSLPRAITSRKTPLRRISHKRRAELEIRPHLRKQFRMGDDIEEVMEHPFLSLWEDGNPLLTGSAMQRTMVNHLDLVGDSYTFIIEDEFGPSLLLTLPPEWMRIKLTENKSAIAHYEQQQEGTAQKIPIPADKIMHIKHPDPANIIYGKSPLEAVGLTVKLYHAYNLFEVALIENDGIPGTIFRTALPLTETQKRRQERKFRSMYGGPRRAGQVAFVSGITSVDRIGYSPRDMMFLQGRKASREDIAGVFSVPMPLLIADGSNLAQADDAKKHHMTYAVKPRLTLMEDQINRDIISKYEGGDSLFVAFDDPIPEDRVANLARATVMVTTSGIVWVNEARAALDLAPEPEWEGVVIEQAPAGGGFLAASDIEQKQVHRARTLEEAIRLLFEEQRRVVLRQMKGISDAHRKIISNIETALPIDEWTQRYFNELLPFTQDIVVSGGEGAAAQVGSPYAFDIHRPEVADFVAEYTFRLSAEVNRTTNTALQKILTTGNAEGQTLAEMTNRVEDLFNHAERFRSARIARTEMVRGRMAGEVEAWKQSGVVQGYYWQTDADPCPWCIEMEHRFGKSAMHMTFGQNYIDRGGALEVEAGTMHMDYSDIPGPPLHPNCQCELIPILMGEELPPSVPLHPGIPGAGEIPGGWATKEIQSVSQQLHIAEQVIPMSEPIRHDIGNAITAIKQRGYTLSPDIRFFAFEGDAEFGGLYSAKSKAIGIQKNFRVRNPGDFIGTRMRENIIHEIGHAVRDTNKKLRRQYIDLYYGGKTAAVSRYARMSLSEEFAEAFTAYVARSPEMGKLTKEQLALFKRWSAKT